MPQRIVIIGASSGLGQRMAIDFARDGWQVGIAARRIDKLQQTQALYPERICVQQMDVTDDNAVNALHTLIDKCGGMDTLLFCSGVGYQDPNLDEEQLEMTLRTNALGFTRIVTAAYKYFYANNKKGHIAAITSVAGTKGIGVAAGYSATKRYQQTYIDALEQLANSQHADIKFTDIRPGFVRTAILNAEHHYPLIMSIDHVAPLIKRAILRKKRIAIVDYRWRMIVTLWRMIPSIVWRRLNLTALNK